MLTTIAVAISVALIATTAEAGTIKSSIAVDRTVYKPDEPSNAPVEFVGHVKSSKRDCTRGRKVLLVGGEVGKPPKTLEKTKTNDKGKFDIKVHGPRRTNIAAHFKLAKARAGNLKCAGDTTNDTLYPVFGQ